ncbi:methyl-accepting chemotaxis protein [Clostridium sp.]|uniref:methyl-accepting chemotaxis protein n=1 Tax=Clostridium sp. TaxID=1506 RepID=UPI002848AEF0|nr:methyl-accepting chemotaxis protein [Clostridium sp.]MDR3593894.1 methyl-accepting chemotaxis protein [Clostridium sp.]
MLSISEVKTFKAIAQMQLNNIRGGAIYFVTEGNKIKWSISSKGLRIKQLEEGETIPSESCSVRAMQEKKLVTMKMARSVYGTRIEASAIPIEDESGHIVGAATIVYPRLHPVAATFNDFAPIISEMFPEGVFLYSTDLKYILSRQSSKNFDMPDIVVGYELKETDIASKTIKAKQFQMSEVDASVHGVPLVIMNYPLYDEEKSGEVVGTFGIAMPKSVAAQLRGMSNNLESGLSSIAASIEQLSSSALLIQTNAQELDKDIKEISTLSDKIDEISTFIKSISDSTNMLGLNAAIESARAGEHGRGFNVVAKEIRKLSEQTKSTVLKIKELTESIKDKVKITFEKSNESLESSKEQAAATQEITASIEELTSLAGELNKISRQV